MTDILNKTTVLVLNSNRQAMNFPTPQEAFCMMATNVATALGIDLGDGGRAQAPSAALGSTNKRNLPLLANRGERRGEEKNHFRSQNQVVFECRRDSQIV
jgi:hypothetical protein